MPFLADLAYLAGIAIAIVMAIFAFFKKDNGTHLG
ncbi:hypothetical protein LCGC14_1685650 [marine sediment metagenome]|uniref:Uncharacterized protein n=1 Tax=marine sediment metagenome TaxID=412755 RepID=A0A0F9HMC3_9ZZZZ